MSQIVKFKTADGKPVFVEVEQQIGGMELPAATGSGVARDAMTTFEGAWEAVTPAVQQAFALIDSLLQKPEQVELEFGIKLSGELGAFIAKAGTEANFKVKLSWKPTK